MAGKYLLSAMILDEQQPAKSLPGKQWLDNLLCTS